MPNQKKLNKMPAGDNLNHFLLVSKFDIKTTKTNKQYLDLELRDETLSLAAKMWDGFEDLIKTLTEGEVVKVDGVIDEYQGQQQIKINRIRKTTDADNITPADFLPKSERELNVMLSELDDFIDSINDSYLSQLLKNVLQGERFEKYKLAPAGKSWHHSYLHGLLEHTLEIVKICDLVSQFHKEVNRDILLTGAILHDFGKTEELRADASFDYTDKGRFIGHIVIAAMMVNNEADKIPGFPPELKDQLIHLILSHQGKLEFASPVEPKTLEAIILYHSDELSAKANAYKNAIKSEESSKSNWTRYLPLAGTALYIPPKTDDDIKESLFDI
jgi:3'-5' exoribonuclease